MKLKWGVTLSGALLISSIVFGVTWSEPQRLPFEFGSLVLDTKGGLWCEVAIEGFYKYNSETSEWLHEIDTLPFGGTPCFDKGDTLWLIQMYTPGLIRYTRYFDEMWSDQEYIPSNSLFDFPLGITSDSSSGIWVAGASSWFGYQAVGYIRYYNGAWGEPQIITDTTEAIEHEGWAITTDTLGRVWIGWLEVDIDIENSMEIQYVKAAYWDDDDWSDEILIATHDWHWATGPSLTPDNEGGMWALWWHEPDDAAPILLKTRHWDGVEWSPVDTIAEAGKSGLCTPKGEIAVDAEGNAWAVWRQAVELDDTYGDIYYSVNQGEGWSTPAPVCEHPAFDINPEIAVDGEGRI